MRPTTMNANGTIFGCLLAGGVCLAPTAQAQLTHYVPFDQGYSADADLHLQGGLDQGFGGNLWFDGALPGEGSTTLSGSLAGPSGLTVAGNSARTSTLGGFSAAFYTFDIDSDMANGEPEDALAAGEHWFSFLGRADAEADFAGLSFKKFFGDEVLYIGKVDDGTGIDGAPGNAVWGVDAQLGTGQVIAGGDATVDTLLVGKLTIGSGGNDDSLNLFINPALGGGAPVTSDATVAFNEDPAAVNGEGNRVRQMDEIRIGSQNGTFYFDEFRIGATFADVTPFTAVGGINGDYNDSGQVEQGDLDLVLQNWGVDTDTAGVPAGWTNDLPAGQIEQTELDGVLQNWGNTAAPDFSGSAVPEPTTLALLGGLTLLATRRR